MSWVRSLVGAVRGRSPRLRHRFVVDEDWRRHDDGGAVRLDARTTIAVTRAGSWVRVDPLVGNDGWRRPGRAVGLVAWAATVGAGWWLGASRGQGPLAMLFDPDR